MTTKKAKLPAALTIAEAADLTARAARAGASVPEFVGYHVRRSAYGALHPAVLAFEGRDDASQSGPKKCADDATDGEGE
ncbi:hypothetical protein [Burkholderia stagnalis]|uniref:hypothetical protein n=1 Tax=Burkholderia stagnalis TaxID=1503054 RepID=UPI00325BC5C8